MYIGNQTVTASFMCLLVVVDRFVVVRKVAQRRFLQHEATVSAEMGYLRLPS
jgi:hypothetical protein